MALFTIFVFGAVILGSGAMLSPAWPTIQPRIGSSAVFALAIIVGGAVFLTSLFGWQTLLVDYLLFALVVGIFLGGTLSVGQQRAEARGETLADADQGWPGPRDLALFGACALVLTGAVLLAANTPAAPADDITVTMAESLQPGQTFDVFTAVVTTDSGSRPHPPAFIALLTYLSGQLGQPLHLVQISIGGVLALLNVWLVYDLGAELRDKTLGRWLVLPALLAGLLLFTAQQYPLLMGLAFAGAFGLYSLRYLRHQYPVDALAAGLLLGAAAITHFGALAGLLLLYAAALCLLTLQRRLALRTGIVAVFGVTATALLAISPWLLSLTF